MFEWCEKMMDATGITLDKIATPFERRRVIEYGSDGNKVVRHWYEVQQVTDTIYKTRDFPDEYGAMQFKLFVFFEGIQNGLCWQWMAHPEYYTVEQMADAAKRDHVDSIVSLMADLSERTETGKFIGNAQIEFVRQFDHAAADRFAKHREKYYAEQEKEEQRRRAERKAKEEAKKAHEQAELEAAKAQYLGWADSMPPIRFGKVDSVLSRPIRCDGKLMTRREFVIQAVKDGWMPERREGVTSWYRGRETNPRTEYRLSRENLCYTVSKTEYDFAIYIVKQKEPSYEKSSLN